MTRLQRLFTECGQSPWLDNLTRGYLRDGTLAGMVADGIRGVTANPTIFARAIEGEGRNVNVTLIFSLGRYAEVIDAYIAGLEDHAAAGGDLTRVHSVASFFVSRVDTEIDRRLDEIDADATRDLHGRAAIAQAALAYQHFRSQFSSDRWERLARRGAGAQRPLWASTSTKNPKYSGTRYVDNLIGPDTVNTLPESTIAAFESHGRVARTIDANIDEAREVMRRLAVVGIDMDDVGVTLEDEGVASFHRSFQDVLAALGAKARQLVVR